MTYDEFLKKYAGKAVDYDGVAGVQCVDLVKRYLKDVFGISAGSWGDAHCYFDNFTAHKELTANFIRISNTPEFVPQKGDICVWKSSLSKGGWGHIAIATGEGDTAHFYSYDQNWTGKHDPCTKIRHNYSHFAGVLRPIDQSKVNSLPKYSVGKNYTLLANVNVRVSPGTSSRLKLRTELTADGQAHALNQLSACLRKGTSVTVKELRTLGSDIWAKIPSGWIAVYFEGEKLAE